jgi:plasmid stabilization system protein ParE
MTSTWQVRLTQLAEQDFIQIIEWTQEHFDQAIRYSQVISDALARHLPAANDEVL